jgi:uncharacterized protein YyaL (SSP411 family)
LANQLITATPETKQGKLDVMTTRPNHLSNEKSPYLQQHINNLVDWHPWGEEAFQEARRREVSVFLSIEYSTCH